MKEKKQTAFSTRGMHYSNSACIQQLICFSEDISRSMLNQYLKFDLLAGNGLLKRINRSDLENGVHISPKMKINSLDIFINISQFMMIQWLKFGIVAVFGLPNMFFGSDHDLGAHKNLKKIEKGMMGEMSQ